MEHDLAYFRLKEEIEDFLYEEADLLDQRRFGEWLDLLAEDLHYFMPMRRNVAFGTHAEHENTRAGQDISWFDEDKWTLSKRIDQIMTGIHWAEEPLSRVCHFVTNIRLAAVRTTVALWMRGSDLLPDGWERMDERRVDRGNIGAVGGIAAGGEGADAAVVHAGPGGGVGRSVS
jgi:hypothetical protein